MEHRLTFFWGGGEANMLTTHFYWLTNPFTMLAKGAGKFALQKSATLPKLKARNTNI